MLFGFCSNIFKGNIPLSQSLAFSSLLENGSLTTNQEANRPFTNQLKHDEP
ncbi:Hypothetical predicted protein [Podarcis lilfordi]|uniref:Uncharacterized protein n=1 Tax=Podarcis lilfordi TaxID=74358 RepID=A0AA35LC14_9SAUR|nr:Hypothetical predicted protein [Podarcis lilfordi]